MEILVTQFEPLFAVSQKNTKKQTPQMAKHCSIVAELGKNSETCFNILASCCVYSPLEFGEKLKFSDSIKELMLQSVLYVYDKVKAKNKRNAKSKMKSIVKCQSIQNFEAKSGVTIEYVLSKVDMNKYSNNNSKAESMIASVHHWSMKREFGIAFQRFSILCVLSLLFPIVLVFQTCFFAIYSAKWGVKTSVFPTSIINHKTILKHGLLLFDVLSAVFPRPSLLPNNSDNILNGKFGSALFAPKFEHDNQYSLNEMKKKEEEIKMTIDWLLRQTKKQIIGRGCISIACAVLFSFVFYNFKHFIRYDATQTQVC